MCADRARSSRLVFHVDGHEHESSGRWPSVHTRRKDEERRPAFELAWKRLVDSFLIRDQPRLVQSHASLKFLTEMLRLLAVVARQDKEKEREKKRGKLDDDVTGYGKLNYGRLLLVQNRRRRRRRLGVAARGYCILTSARLAESLLSDFAMRYKHGWRPV